MAQTVLHAFDPAFVPMHAIGAMSLVMICTSLLMAQTVLHAFDPAFVPMLCCARYIICHGIQLSTAGASSKTIV